MNNRRTFLQKLAGISIGSAFGFTTNGSPYIVYNSDPLPSLKGRKILFVYGGWDGHEPEKFRDYLTPWLNEQGAEVMLSPNLDPYLDEKLMASIDLFLQIFTMSKITPEQEKGLLTAIKNGAGMAGWHGGMGDAFRDNPEYQYMVGGQWVSHPGGVIDYTIKILNTGDAITSGFSDFKIKSEQYYMHVDPNVNVLATTTFSNQHDNWIDGCTMPVIWKKMYGKGRIFYTSMGHNLSHVLEAKEGMKVIKRGIQWASASKYLPAEKWISPKY